MAANPSDVQRAARGDGAQRGSKSVREEQLARENWERYEYVRQRGHLDYCEVARRCENFYLGGGLQWSEEDKQILEEQGRKPVEINEIMDAVHQAVGYQLANRMDIAFRPMRGEATESLATTMSKVAMQVANNNSLHNLETQVFADGLIQHRGYYDIRLAFDDSLNGEIKITTLDPLDVIPDPDGKDYDPDTWADVNVTRWLSLDDVEGFYGPEARQKIEAQLGILDERDFGSDEDGTERNRFGESDAEYNPLYDAVWREAGITRVRVVERQFWQREMTMVVVSRTGDIRIAENSTPEQRAAWRRQGFITTRRIQKRVRWRISTSTVLLFDDWSPYDHFTIVPYFALFRRGRTRGIVDNAIGPQEVLNKAVSQNIHIINTTANSGWIIEQNSLTNMDAEDLETEGARTGLVLEIRGDTKIKPEKIKPNEVPRGIEALIALGSAKIKGTTGNTDQRKGELAPDASGIAIQSAQYASQQSLALPLDNLARTRNLLGRRILDLVQRFYTDEKVFRITSEDPNTGKPVTEELRVNTRNPETGELLNDLTAGEYDVVITEQPMQVTFQNSQFNQALAMKKLGVAIPDDVVIKNSSLAGKAELIERMQSAANKPNPVDETKAMHQRAQAVAKLVEAMFSAMRSAGLLAATPELAGLADTILRSAGFIDQDAAPLVPTPAAPVPGALPPVNTNPLTPDNPERGMNTGIEAGAVPTGA